MSKFHHVWKWKNGAILCDQCGDNSQNDKGYCLEKPPLTFWEYIQEREAPFIQEAKDRMEEGNIWWHKIMKIRNNK